VYLVAAGLVGGTGATLLILRRRRRAALLAGTSTDRGV